MPGVLHWHRRESEHERHSDDALPAERKTDVETEKPKPGQALDARDR